jgi:hypothetical protein
MRKIFLETVSASTLRVQWRMKAGEAGTYITFSSAIANCPYFRLYNSKGTDNFCKFFKSKMLNNYQLRMVHAAKIGNFQGLLL